jgi:hypothetical protein
MEGLCMIVLCHGRWSNPRWSRSPLKPRLSNDTPHTKIAIHQIKFALMKNQFIFASLLWFNHYFWSSRVNKETAKVHVYTLHCRRSPRVPSARFHHTALKTVFGMPWTSIRGAARPERRVRRGKCADRDEQSRAIKGCAIAHRGKRVLGDHESYIAVPRAAIVSSEQSETPYQTINQVEIGPLGHLRSEKVGTCRCLELLKQRQ